MKTGKVVEEIMRTGINTEDNHTFMTFVLLRVLRSLLTVQLRGHEEHEVF
jgi:hypothetical protein